MPFLRSRLFQVAFPSVCALVMFLNMRNFANRREERRAFHSQPSICGPLIPRQVDLQCGAAYYSTRLSPACKPRSKLDVIYPALVTGMPGNGAEATQHWFRRHGFPATNESVAPSENGIVFSWVLAFNNWNKYPSHAQLLPFKVM